MSGFVHEKFVVVQSDGQKLCAPKINQICDDFFNKITKKSLVLLCCSNEIDDLIIYLTCTRKNIPIMLISEEVPNKILDEIIANFRPGYVVTNRQLKFYKSSELFLKTFYCTSFDEVVHPDISLLMTTSGSTGTAKFVKLSYQNIRSNTEDIVSYLGLKNSDTSITSLPMHYTYGLTLINSAIFSGGTLVLTNSTVTQKEFWELFKNFSVTNLAGVPYTFQILNSMRFFRRNQPSLRFITQAGGKMDDKTLQDLMEYCDRNGKELFLMYGQAEASPRMSYVPPSQVINKSQTVGIAVPSGKIDILDAQENGTGEIIFTGPNVFGGYAKSFEDLLNFNTASTLETGDIGYIDDDGYLVVTGRKKRFIKLFGHRVGLDELETHLSRTFSAYTFTCAGHDNKLHVKYLGDNFSEVLQDHLVDLLNVNAKAIKVERVDEIPRNAYGKIVYV